MSQYGYEIKTSLDFYKKLLDEREDFLKNPTSSRFAINCAFTGWHLHEWIYKEYKRSSPALNQYRDKQEFRAFLYSHCPSLHTFRDLADGSKHFVIDQRPSSILNTEIKKTGERLVHRKILEGPTLIVRIKFGEVGAIITFHDLLYEVTSYWYTFLRKNLNLDVEAVLNDYTSF